MKAGRKDRDYREPRLGASNTWASPGRKAHRFFKGLRGEVPAPEPTATPPVGLSVLSRWEIAHRKSHYTPTAVKVPGPPQEARRRRRGHCSGGVSKTRPQGRGASPWPQALLHQLKRFFFQPGPCCGQWGPGGVYAPKGLTDLGPILGPVRPLPILLAEPAAPAPYRGWRTRPRRRRSR